VTVIRAAAALALTLVWASAAGAQRPVIVFGRVQDVESAAPVASALILASDSSSAVYADSLGNFAIELRGAGPYVIYAVREGYEPASFELPETARSSVSTLLLRRTPSLGNDVRRGDRIRITSDPTSGEFVVGSVNSGGLLLRTEPEIEVPIASLQSLQVQRGREISTAEGLVGGAAVGALVGAVFGLQDLQAHYSSLTRMSMKESVALGVGIGVLVGLFISRTSDEVWEEVTLPYRLDARPRVASVPENDPIVVGDVGSNDLVELTVRNRTPDPIDAFAWWEGGPRVSLGVVRANSVSSFVTARRSPGVVLVVSPVSTPGPPTGPAPRPSEFIVVGRGERLEWVVLTPTGVVQDYLRLTPR
jgi:hypothetical protein